MSKKTKKVNRFNLPLRTAGASFFLLLLVFTLLLSDSCKKDDNPVGLSVLPPGDLLNPAYNDTASMITYTVREDSLFTDETSLNLIGSYNDPLFGKVVSSVYTQLSLPGAVGSFGDNPVLDSVVLVLPYSSSYYGRITDAQNFKVYELDQSMHKDTTYHSKRILATKTSILGSLTFIPGPTDSVKLGTKNHTPHLRIKLDSAFGANILAQGGISTTTDEQFKNYLKGVYITPDNPSQASGTGAILYFNLTNPIGGLTLYYRKNKFSAATGDTVNYTFQINGNSARFTNFTHDYSTATTSLSDQVNNINLNAGKDLTYVQAMAGLKTKIVFPHIKNYVTNGRVVVNKAELIIKADTSAGTGYTPPSKLSLIRFDSLNKGYFLIDELSGSIGGTYNSASGEYRFYIPRHLQKLMDGTLKDYGLGLVVSGATVSANRVVLRGSENTTSKMILNLSTTKIN